MKFTNIRNRILLAAVIVWGICLLIPLKLLAWTLTVNYGTGDGSYYYYEEPTIVADPPASGQRFKQWTPELTYEGSSRYLDGITHSTTRFNMPNDNITVTATYEADGTSTNAASTNAAAGATNAMASGQSQRCSIVAVGIVNGQGRVVTVSGVSRKTWAEYALWYDSSGTIYFKSGERFDGKVHSNNKLWFDGNPEFMTNLTSSASTFGGSTNSCIFHAGFTMNYATSTMAEVTFTSMLENATLIVTGITKIAFSGTNMLVANAAWSWTNRTYNLPGDEVFCIANGSGTNYGDVYISGTNLNGRITVMAEQDIYITNNLVYANTNIVASSTNLSDDALGLLAGGDITVERSFPSNGVIYAHMMATGNITTNGTDGSFSVKNYNSREKSGKLNVYGGIVQWFRGAVGTFSDATLYSGFDKNYNYDTRFSYNPPPCYPIESSTLSFDVWKDH